MQVDLSTLFNTRGVLQNSDSAELAVARAFAAAANATHSGQTHITAPESVTVELTLRPSPNGWSRQLKDVLLRCVDRAMGRVFPPLDVLQYVSGESPTFISNRDTEVTTMLRAVFTIRPSIALFPSSLLKPHSVEGEVVEGIQLPEPADAAALTAAASESMRDSLSDMDLWYRARAAHQQYDSSIPLDSIQQLAGSLLGSAHAAESGGDGTATHQSQPQESKLTLLQWQLARWLAELFLNEGGWARPHRSSSSSSPSKLGGGSAAAGSSSVSSSAQQRGSVEVTRRRLFHAPLRPTYPHVVDAAIFSHPSSAEVSALSEAVPRRQLHADVRGMEWDGLLLGYTTRYAYVAVPYFVSTAETTAAAEAACVWSIVCRLPIPAFAHEQASQRKDDEDAKDGESATAQGSRNATRKRTRDNSEAEIDVTAAASRQGSDGPTLAQMVLSRCFNAEEAMRHDTNAAAVFHLADAPYIVTVRAHRVYCARADAAKQPQPLPSSRPTSLCAKKPHPAASPYKLSMTLEDAYVVGHRLADVQADSSLSSSSPQQTHWAASLFGMAAASTASTSLARSLHTFPDVVSVVRESCHRFTRTHERFCAVYARCLEVKQRQTPPKQPSATPPATATKEGEGEEEEKADTEVGVAAAEDGERKELPSPVAAWQQLRLLQRAETVYVSVADSMSVHYKKLRGAAQVAIPAVRTTADVAHLEESNNVEFKAKVGLTTGDAARGDGRRQASTMDTERLRNTIAAMAACRGGVVVIGVADDGHIVGHAKQLEVGKHLRISGFCPAMVKDAVQVKELRWLGKAATTSAGAAVSSDAEGNDGAAPAKRAMPENWWKAGNSSSSRAKGGTDASIAHKTQGTSGDQVITVISVEKGQAPFYATAKNTPPYQRGCASTVVMPTVVLAKRLMKELV